MDFIEETTGMDGSRLAVLEASLIRLGCDEMRRRGLDPFQYCLLHYLRDVGSHYYWSDLVQSTWTFGESFLQGDESTNLQILRNLGVVQGVSYLLQHFCSELLFLIDQISVEAVRPKSLVKV